MYLGSWFIVEDAAVKRNTEHISELVLYIQGLRRDWKWIREEVLRMEFSEKIGRGSVIRFGLYRMHCLHDKRRQFETLRNNDRNDSALTCKVRLSSV